MRKATTGNYVMNLIFLGVAAIGGLFSIVSLAKDELKLGFVDLQRALHETSTGKKAMENFDSLVKAKQKEIQDLESDIRKRNEDLEKKKSLLSAEVRSKKEMELQNDMLKHRELVMKSQADLQLKNRELTEPILAGLGKAVTKIAESESYEMIFEKQGLLWAKKNTDLTEEVIRIFERDFKDSENKKKDNTR